MADILYSDIDDAVIAARRSQGRSKFTDVASDIQKYVGFKSLMRSNRVEDIQTYGCEWTYLVEDNDSAEHTGLFHVDDVNVNDGLKKARIDMKHTKANWAYDQHEIDMNVRNAEERILSLTKVRSAQCDIAIANLVEADLWRLPAATDTLAPVGFPYYIVRNASAGFNGGNPSGYDDVANVDRDVYTATKNYTDRYVYLTVDDLINKMEKACILTNWESPADISDYSSGSDLGMYTNIDVFLPLTQLAREQNDNLGQDLAWNSGKVMFRGTPVTWVPKLDSVTTDPIYGIQWGDFKILVDKDWFLKEDGPVRSPTQSDVRVMHKQLTWNLKCTNPRRQWIVDIA